MLSSIVNKYSFYKYANTYIFIFIHKITFSLSKSRLPKPELTMKHAFKLFNILQYYITQLEKN